MSVQLLRNMWSYRDLIFSLVRRQYQLRYRQSAAGLIWTIVPPVATLGLATLVFHRVAGVETTEVSYPVFTMSGLVLWTFFASSLTNGIPSVVGSLPMVTRFAFPKAVLPFSMIGLAGLDLGVSVVLFGIVAFADGSGLTWTALFLPILILIEVVLVTGLVLLMSAVNMFARDIKLGVPLLIQAWLFLTPVLYPLGAVPKELRSVYLVNPMTGLVENAHRILAYGQMPEWTLLVPSALGALVAVVWGSWYFSATENRFADVV
jgi:lipopolysaccharide transport system permease protein